MQESIETGFFNETSSTKVECLSEIFVEQIEPVVNEKHEFQKRHASKTVKFFCESSGN